MSDNKALTLEQLREMDGEPANAGHVSAVMSATAEKARIDGAGNLTRGF